MFAGTFPAPLMKLTLLAGALLMTACGSCIDDPPPVVPAEDQGEMDAEVDTPADMEPDQEPDFVYMIPDIPTVEECDEQARDEPDRFALDLDCDGIDGEVERSVFVATYGADSNDGSRYAPLLTIQAAIDLAASQNERKWVLVQEGRYEETLELVDGVHIVGGYEFGWRRDGDGFSLVTGGNPTIYGAAITSPDASEKPRGASDRDLERGALKRGHHGARAEPRRGAREDVSVRRLGASRRGRRQGDIRRGRLSGHGRGGWQDRQQRRVMREQQPAFARPRPSLELWRGPGRARRAAR